MPLIAGCVFAACVAWMIVRAVRQFHAYETIGDETFDPAGLPSLAVVVPARDEASNIGRCLAGLSGQDYPADRLTMVVVDDNSTDDTVEIVRRFARDDARVRLISGGRLPVGWAGKPHACAAGAAAADARWICFVDADTLPGRRLLSSALHAARVRGLDMLSLEPFQEMVTCWERLILPVGFFMLAVTQNLSRVNSPASPEAAVNGQFILIRKSVYDDIGGHAAVRGRIAEDSALARLAKHRGYRLAVLGAEQLIRTRMYRDWPSLWEGLSKTTVQIVGGIPAAAAVGAGALLLALAAVLLPLWSVSAFAAGPSFPHALAAALAGLAAMTLLAIHLAEARHFRLPWWYGLLFPLAYALGALIALNSALEHWRGQVPWKGRIYSPH